MPDDRNKPHVTQQRMEQLITARATRLAAVVSSGNASPKLVALFIEQLLDISIAYCGDDLAKAFYTRMLRDVRVRCGLCLDCGSRPALATGVLCAGCQATEDQAQAKVQAELLAETARFDGVAN